MTRSVHTGNAEHYVWGDGCDGWHLVKRDDLSIIQERVPPGKSEILHYHERARQFFYVIRGTATLVVGNETVLLQEREGLEIAPRVPHQLRNDSSTDLEFLVISSPKSHGDRMKVNPGSVSPGQPDFTGDTV